MRKQKSRLAWCFIVLAILVVAVDFLLEIYVPDYRVWNILGLRPSSFPRFVFVSAACFFIAAVLQFPFREEEGWTCKCGYDLSYITKKSLRCPECGAKVLLEWAPQPGVLSRATTKRLCWTIVLFTISIGIFAFGVVAWTL